MEPTGLPQEVTCGSFCSRTVAASNLPVPRTFSRDDLGVVVARLTLQASGASDFGGYGLAVDTCTVAASGGSDVTVTVHEALTVQANGGSDVLYAGNGHVRAVNTSGGSRVKRVSH